MNDGIVTKLEFLLKEGAAIIKEQADEIERLRDALIECESVISRLKIEKKYTDGL